MDKQWHTHSPPIGGSNKEFEKNRKIHVSRRDFSICFSSADDTKKKQRKRNYFRLIWSCFVGTECYEQKNFSNQPRTRLYPVFPHACGDKKKTFTT